MNGGPLSYEPYFGLTKKAFSLASDPEFLYESPSHSAALAALLAGIRRREGMLALTGDVGTGKTTVCRSVLRNLDRTTFSAFIPDPFASREDLLKMLLIDFGVTTVQDIATGPLARAGRTELSYLLSSFLDTLAPLDAFVVVFIDEAQNMSPSLIEEVRVLSDTYNRYGQLQLVFVGQLEFLATLKSPAMRQVDQRISVHAQLEPLTVDETLAYVQHRLQVAGCSPNRPVFSPTALTLIHESANGIPRVINRLCDRSMQLAFERRLPMVDRDLVAEYLQTSAATIPAPVTPPSIAPPADTAAALSSKGNACLQETAQPPTDETGLSAFASEDSAGSPSPGGVVPKPFELSRRADKAERSVQRVRRQIGRGAIAATLALVVLNAIVAAGSYMPGAWSSPEGLELPPLPAPPGMWVGHVEPPAPAPVVSNQTAPAQPAPTPTRVAVTTTSTYGGGAFAVAVGAFRTRARAVSLSDQLTGDGFVSFTRETPARDGVLQQVFLGPFQTQAAAERELARLRNGGGYADARVMTLNPPTTNSRTPGGSEH